jgi:hypothetical protein
VRRQGFVVREDPIPPPARKRREVRGTVTGSAHRIDLVPRSRRRRGSGAEPVIPGMGTRCRSISSPTGSRPRVIVPVANHDDNQHAPDENLRIANLWYAIDLYGALLTMP